MKNPDVVSTVCPRCSMLIKPETIRDAVSERYERADGHVVLQYAHDGECPAASARRWNAARDL